MPGRVNGKFPSIKNKVNVANVSNVSNVANVSNVDNVANGRCGLMCLGTKF